MSKVNGRGGIEPGSLRGRAPAPKSQTQTDADIIAEVASLSANEFKAKYIKGPNAAKLMEEYVAAKNRRGKT
jgi:hypothetical protein